METSETLVSISEYQLINDIHNRETCGMVQATMECLSVNQCNVKSQHTHSTLNACHQSTIVAQHENDNL